MTTNLVVPTESQLPIAGEKLTFQTWKSDGEKLLRRFRANEQTLETDQWEIGEWTVRGIEKFGKERAYDEAEQITGFDRPYLQTVVWVVNRFSVDSSLRKETKLKWSHFKELAYIRDGKLRASVLDYFDDGFEHSVRKIREHVQEELAKHKGENSDKKQKAKSKQWVFMQVPLKEDHRRDIKTLAKLDHKDPDKFLRGIVIEYLERKDIAAKLEKAHKKSKR